MVLYIHGPEELFNGSTPHQPGFASVGKIQTGRQLLGVVGRPGNWSEDARNVVRFNGVAQAESMICLRFTWKRVEIAKARRDRTLTPGFASQRGFHLPLTLIDALRRRAEPGWSHPR